MRSARRQPSIRAALPFAGAVLALAMLGLLLVGCGGGERTPPPSRSAGLVVGTAWTPIGTGGGVRLARRFARAYARGAYLRRAPDIGAESGEVRRALSAVALRVPPPRRHLHPRLLSLRLSLGDDGSLLASAKIGDGRFPPFTVGFTVSRDSGRWLVTAVAPPD